MARLAETLQYHIINFGAENKRIRSIDERFCRDFATYLIEESSQKGGISATSAALYFKVLRCVLNYAVSESLIKYNPAPHLKEVGLAGKSGKERGYLTRDEIILLAKTRCGNGLVKKAFMFGCFTGLRISDIRRLHRENIKHDGNGRYYVELKIKKTGRWLTIPLSKSALAWLPEGDELFHALPHISSIERMLKSWMDAAGIEKHVTTHTARHTFATMLINSKVDIYTVSKLLGHTDVKTTSIYAQLTDKSKEDAVERLNFDFSNLPATMCAL